MSTVFITGAGSGIGREFVQQYLAEGWTVVCTARQDAHLAELRDAGAECFNVDMQDAPGILKTAALLQDRTLDLAILNAGIMRGRDMGFADIHIEDWQESFFVNCIAPRPVGWPAGDAAQAQPRRKACGLVEWPGIDRQQRHRLNHHVPGVQGCAECDVENTVD